MLILTKLLSLMRWFKEGFYNMKIGYLLLLSAISALAFNMDLIIEMSNKLQSHPLETTELIIWAIGSSIIGLILLGYSIKLRYFDSGILKLVMVVTLGCFIIGVYSVCRLYFQIFL